ncbi:uncharacterized protein LOC111832098 [Capsella rubella]|uniref:uncharacterized protein LOC111832098 n=1 Tax=Capsella rubella TaxID=81985 RepID=UPI000CD5AEEE|nr:uncharacterized protein LOC111832098 [Capsella rubella]
MSGKRLRMEGNVVGRRGGNAELSNVELAESRVGGQESVTVPASFMVKREPHIALAKSALRTSSIRIVKIVEKSDQFIHAIVGEGGEDPFHLLVVYAAPTISRRSGLWDKLKDVLCGIDEPVLVGGDFNTILRLDERTGGNGRLSLDSLAFGDWISDTSLIDMGFRGNNYTWRRGRVLSTYIAKRLDRVMCNAAMRLKWQEASVTHLLFLASDHPPLYVQLCPTVEGNPKQRPFRFEAAWLKHDSFKEMLENSWNNQLSTPEAFERNTRLFHTSTIIRRRRNRIDMLKNEDGECRYTRA